MVDDIQSDGKSDGGEESHYLVKIRRDEIGNTVYAYEVQDRPVLLKSDQDLNGFIIEPAQRLSVVSEKSKFNRKRKFFTSVEGNNKRVKFNKGNN